MPVDNEATKRKQQAGYKTASRCANCSHFNPPSANGGNHCRLLNAPVCRHKICEEYQPANGFKYWEKT